MGSVTVVYDDFTGGYYVGARAQDQPRNTWTGNNVWVDASTGDLMPMSPVIDDPVEYTDVPGDMDNFSYPVRDGSVPAAGSDAPAAIYWVQSDATTVWRMWRRNSDGAVERSASTVTVSTETWTGAVPVLAASAGTLYLWLGSGGAFMHRFLDISAVTTTAVAAMYDRLLLWNNRMVTWDPAASNLLFFSDPDVFTTWPTTSFYQIGGHTPIQTVMLGPNSLLIGKEDGWWEIRGVLGSTAVVSQILTTAGAITEHAHRTANGTILIDGAGAGVSFLGVQGVIPRVVNARPHAEVDNASGITGSMGTGENMARCTPDGILIGYRKNSDDVDTGWIYDQINNRWSRYALPDSLAGGGGDLRWAWTFDGTRYATASSGNPDPIFGVLSGVGGQNRIVSFAGGLHTTAIDDDATCTVTLAAHDAPSGTLERVREVWVEVVAGVPVTAKNATCTVRVEAVGIPDGPEPSAFTVPYTWTRNGTELSAGARYMIRYIPSDLPACCTLTPEVTLRGCKLRRLVLVVDREGIRAS